MYYTSTLLHQLLICCLPPIAIMDLAFKERRNKHRALDLQSNTAAKWNSTIHSLHHASSHNSPLFHQSICLFIQLLQQMLFHVFAILVNLLGIKRFLWFEVVNSFTQLFLNAAVKFITLNERISSFINLIPSIFT